jgi:hypothetical protein
MFFYDPSGNALEFKSFANPEQAFMPWQEEDGRQRARMRVGREGSRTGRRGRPPA